MRYIVALCIVAVLFASGSVAHATDLNGTTLTPPVKKTRTPTQVFTDTPEPTSTGTPEPTSTKTSEPSATATVTDPVVTATKTSTHKDKTPHPTPTKEQYLPQTGFFDGRLSLDMMAVLGVILAGIIFMTRVIRRSMNG